MTGDGGAAVFTDAFDSTLASDSSAGLAYCLAPVSIIRRRHETVSGGMKYTVAAFDDGRLDFVQLRTRLNELEPGWTPAYGRDGKVTPGRTASSPMQSGSTLSPEQVLKVAAECLL